ncbi:hypothetical protein XENOCAPTIV_005518 [Xenoophorus captivus]|uniref:Uncharacterized protein n=1 Tax=Xenoophorus captivus TaxID=1517983 RepID=A0ABV0SCI2_9TELE
MSKCSYCSYYSPLTTSIKAMTFQKQLLLPINLGIVISSSFAKLTKVEMLGHNVLLHVWRKTGGTSAHYQQSLLKSGTSSSIQQLKLGPKWVVNQTAIPKPGSKTTTEGLSHGVAMA